MTVNLEKNEIILQRVVGSGIGETTSSASAMLQGGDRNVNVLSCGAQVLEKRKNVDSGGITVFGSVLYAVTYVNTEGQIREKRTQSDFELEIPVEGVENGTAQVLYTIKGTESREKDGRLDVSALIEAQGIVLREVPTELVTYVDAGEILACKTAEISYLSAPVSAEARALLSKEIALPAGEYRVAAAESQTLVDKVFFLDGLARVLGTVTVTVLLADAENRLSPYVVTMPLDENAENNDLASGMTGETAIRISSLKADILYGEEDNAALVVEVVAEASVTAEAQKQARALQDCYPLSELPMASVQTSVTYVAARVSRASEQTLTGKIEGKEPVFAFTQTVALEVPKEGNALEGLVLLTAVDKTGEANTQEIPFSLDFGEKTGQIFGVTVGNASVSGNSYSIPVKLFELGYTEETAVLLSDTREEVAPVLKSGVTIRFTAPGETKWDVAKACRVRESALKEGQDGRSYMVYRRLTEA